MRRLVEVEELDRGWRRCRDAAKRAMVENGGERMREVGRGERTDE